MRRNEIPLLEFDEDKTAVIAPDHEGIGRVLPKKAVLAFLYDEVENCARALGGRVAAEYESVSGNRPVYVVNYKGQEIALLRACVGAPIAAMMLDWLHALGAEEIISCGSCGALEKFEEGRFLVPCRALRDEGTSFHYLPPSRYVEVDPRARKAIQTALTQNGLKYEEVTTWTTDGFLRETKEKVLARRSEGCAVVEMECSAMAACARMRGFPWGQLLYTADSLADVEKHDGREWGKNSRDIVLKLSMDAVLCLGNDEEEKPNADTGGA